MDDAVAKALKLQALKVAVGLLVIGGLVGARIVSVRPAGEEAPAPAAAPAPATGGPSGTLSKAPAPAPAESEPAEPGWLERLGGGKAAQASPTEDPNRPGRCELPGEGIQFMRGTDCRNRGGRFTPLAPEKKKPASG